MVEELFRLEDSGIDFGSPYDTILRLRASGRTPGGQHLCLHIIVQYPVIVAVDTRMVIAAYRAAMCKLKSEIDATRSVLTPKQQ